MITRLHLSNFQSWPQVVLELSPITVIIGETDAGKSALLRGLSCLLFNAMEGTGMVRAGQSSAEVAIETAEGHLITWARGTNLNRYTLDGQVYDKPGRAVPEPIRQALQIQELEFDAEVVRLQWAPQMDAPFLLADSGAKATRMLGVAGNAAITAQAARLAQQEVKKEQDAHRAASNQLERLQAQLASYADVDTAAPIADALQQALTQIETLRMRRQQVQVVQRDHEVALVRQITLGREADRLLALTAGLDKHVAIVQRQTFLRLGGGALESQERLRDIADNYQLLIDRLRMQVRLQEIVGVCQDVASVLRRRSTLADAMQSATDHYDQAYLSHRTLVDTLTCPTCGQLKDAA